MEISKAVAEGRRRPQKGELHGRILQDGSAVVVDQRPIGVGDRMAVENVEALNPNLGWVVADHCVGLLMDGAAAS
ncbi:MAG: hypothetical protein M3Y04_03455 [Actinomycetota bacterium]|nr:hypothetical protein [Actinomycetota bacterium]